MFPDFIKKYGIRNILDGLFYNFPTLEEKWGYLSRLINHYSGNYSGSKVMDDLKKIIGDKPYFVITSNGEGHFGLSGFDPLKVNEIEGNWTEFRCSNKCSTETIPSIEIIRKMAEYEKDGKIPTDKIPVCPKCGGVLELYNANPPKKGIVEEQSEFLKKYHGKKLIILELGIGYRNQLIKAPLMRLTMQEKIQHTLRLILEKFSLQII